MKEGQKQGVVLGDFKHASTRLPASTYQKLKLISVLEDADIHVTFAKAIEEYAARHAKDLMKDLLK
jgi:hypothetical protein